MRCRGVLAVIVDLPEMHIPPWYLFSSGVLPLALSLSKGRPFMVRPDHHERPAGLDGDNRKALASYGPPMAKSWRTSSPDWSRPRPSSAASPLTGHRKLPSRGVWSRRATSRVHRRLHPSQSPQSQGCINEGHRSNQPHTRSNTSRPKVHHLVALPLIPSLIGITASLRWIRA